MRPDSVENGWWEANEREPRQPNVLGLPEELAAELLAIHYDIAAASIRALQALDEKRYKLAGRLDIPPRILN